MRYVSQKNKGVNLMYNKNQLTSYMLTDGDIIEKCAQSYIRSIKENAPDREQRVHSILLYDLTRLRLSLFGKKVECYDPESRDIIKTWRLREELYEFDDLSDEVQEKCIRDWMKTDTATEMATDDCRHMKFNKDGDIKRGYDK